MNNTAIQVAAVLIIKDHTVLLVRHTNSKHIEGIYGLPGGKVDAGESEIEAARRELEEETGLLTTTKDLIPLKTLFASDVKFRNGEIKPCAMRVFLCTRYEGTLGGTAREIPEWIAIGNIDRLMLLPHVKNAVREGLLSRE